MPRARKAEPLGTPIAPAAVITTTTTTTMRAARPFTLAELEAFVDACHLLPGEPKITSWHDSFSTGMSLGASVEERHP